MSITKLLLSFSVSVLCWSASSAQIVYKTKYPRQANVKVYVTQYKQDADLVVFKTPHLANSQGNKGQWYFTANEGEANKRIYYIEHKEEADLQVYFTTNAAEAGWQKKKKSYIME